MKRNEELYNAIRIVLSDKNKLKFGELNTLISTVLCAEKYSEKQLRNVLYRQVKNGTMNRDKEGKYSMNYSIINQGDGKDSVIDVTIMRKATILDTYKEDILKICKETEKKLKNPFETFSNDEIVDAKKTYELNKKIMNELK